MKTCRTCTYFVPRTKKSVTTGKCHRYPPSPTNNTHDNYPSWPRLTSKDWCGEHKTLPVPLIDLLKRQHLDQFKPGMKVLCLHNQQKYGLNTQDELTSRDMGGLQRGMVYTVKEVRDDRLILEEIERGPNETGFFASRFEPWKSATQHEG